MNDGHDHLDSELQRLIRGCPEPERLSDERRQDIWQAMAARLERTSVSSRRYRLVHSRTLRWVLPVAIAAGIVLVVGLWPGKLQSGRVYAFSEMPSLVRSAATFHVHGVQRWIMAGKLVDLPIDSWHAASGSYRCVGIYAHENGVDLPDIVCDGRYQMEIDHVKKTVSFARVTPLQTRITFLGDMQNMLFGNIARRNGLARTGMETIDGRTCEVWQREETPPEGNVVMARINKYWFDPSTGVLARAETWAKDKYSGQFQQCFLIDKSERNIELPAGIFDTTPPAGYTLTNTKETATVKSICQVNEGETLETAVHPGFVLPDGSVILSWSVRELGKDEPQDSLFAGLVAGGELPKLPLEVYGLTPQGATKPAYLGRHLAWTRKDRQCFEWALYVPDQDLPQPISSFALLTRPHPPERDLEGNDSPSYPPFTIEVTAGDFDELVLGSMAELSDNGLRPEKLSLQSVLQLADAIRRTKTLTRAIPASSSADPASRSTSPIRHAQDETTKNGIPTESTSQDL